MTKQEQTYFYFDEPTRTVFYSNELVEDRPDLMFLGSSMNPNHKMTVSVMVQNMDIDYNYKIIPLP
jgi:hypothetical protein